MKRFAHSLLLWLLWCVPMYADITLRGTAKAGSALNGGNVTLTWDAGGSAPATGDTIIVCGGQGGTNAGDPSVSGYTQIVLFNATTNKMGCWYKIQTGTPDTTTVMTGSGSSVETSVFAGYVLQSVDSGITDATTVENHNDAGGANPDPSAIVTVTDKAWVIVAAISQVSDATIVAPSGYSNKIAANAADTNPATIGMATLQKTPAGSEDPATWTTWSGGNHRNLTLAIKPAGAGGGATSVPQLMLSGIGD